MSVFQRTDRKTGRKLPTWEYSFDITGRRFQGVIKDPTVKTERQAQVWELREKDRRTEELRAGVTADVADMNFRTALARYQKQVVVKWKNPRNVAAADAYLARLEDMIGAGTLLRDISTNMLIEIVAERTQATVKGLGVRQIRPATVNRHVVQPLRHILRRARDIWGVPQLQPIIWKELWLEEGNVRKREIEHDEERAFRTALPVQHQRLVNFARASGLRISECLLRWRDINWASNRIRRVGKGGKDLFTPINSTMRAIIEACMVDKHPEYVFATRYGGLLRPVTYDALAKAWRRARGDGKLPVDLKIHDIRHDYGTKMMRHVDNPLKVRDAMNHSSFKVTERYLYVRDTEVADAAEAVAQKIEADWLSSQKLEDAGRSISAAHLRVIEGGRLQSEDSQSSEITVKSLASGSK